MPPLVQPGFPFSIPRGRFWPHGLLGASAHRPGGFFRLSPDAVVALLGYSPKTPFSNDDLASMLVDQVFPAQAAEALLHWVLGIVLIPVSPTISSS
jgi:hypothetical protein